MQNKISVILITGNEEENIGDCLKSVNWADEIIVVDSESTDRTVEIAKTYTEKVFIKSWDGYSDQIKYALSKVNNEWVLSIDADERVTVELKEYILSSNLNDANGYYILLDNYFLGKKIIGCGWSNDYQMRLFKKSEVTVTESPVKKGFVVAGKSMNINDSIVHDTNRSLHQTLERTNYYSTLLSQEKAGSKKVGIISLTFKPLIAFFQQFITCKVYKDGVYGFLVSLIYTITKLQELAKIWEINRNAK